MASAGTPSAADEARVGECFAEKVGAWFAHEGRRRVREYRALRQMNMAVALAASKMNELEGEPELVERMRRWLDETESRAVVRRAGARADAMVEARSWLEACVGAAAAGRRRGAGR